MNDLTERAIDVARGRLRSEYGGSAVEVTIAALAEAGMLTDPDAESPRIAAAWGLVQAWTEKSDRSLARAHTGAATDCEHSALTRQARTAADCATALRRVLDGDPDTTGGAS